MRRAKLQVDGIGVSLEGMGPCGQSNQIMNAAQEKRERVRRKIEAIAGLVDVAYYAHLGFNVQKDAERILKFINGVEDEVR